MIDPIEDPLEALYEAPSAGEGDTPKPERKANLVLEMQIEGTLYRTMYIMPIGFPYRYENERAMVNAVAMALGETVTRTFQKHWYERTEGE
jgi:hypothetical protein